MLRKRYSWYHVTQRKYFDSQPGLKSISQAEKQEGRQNRGIYGSSL
jgi:hypothetical protein